VGRVACDHVWGGPIKKKKGWALETGSRVRMVFRKTTLHPTPWEKDRWSRLSLIPSVQLKISEKKKSVRTYGQKMFLQNKKESSRVFLLGRTRDWTKD